MEWDNGNEMPQIEALTVSSSASSVARNDSNVAIDANTDTIHETDAEAIPLIPSSSSLEGVSLTCSNENDELHREELPYDLPHDNSNEDEDEDPSPTMRDDSFAANIEDLRDATTKTSAESTLCPKRITRSSSIHEHVPHDYTDPHMIVMNQYGLVKPAPGNHQQTTCNQSFLSLIQQAVYRYHPAPYHANMIRSMQLEDFTFVWRDGVESRKATLAEIQSLVQTCYDQFVRSNSATSNRFSFTTAKSAIGTVQPSQLDDDEEEESILDDDSLNQDNDASSKKRKAHTLSNDDSALPYRDKDVLLGHLGVNHPGSVLYRQTVFTISHDSAATSGARAELAQRIQHTIESQGCRFYVYKNNQWVVASSSKEILCKIMSTISHMRSRAETNESLIAQDGESSTAKKGKQLQDIERNHKRPRVQDSYNDNDVLFGMIGRAHPGTRFCRDTIRNLMIDRQCASWDDSFVPILRKKLKGRRFFVLESDHWYEADSAQVAENLAKVYNRQHYLYRIQKKKHKASTVTAGRTKSVSTSNSNNNTSNKKAKEGKASLPPKTSHAKNTMNTKVSAAIVTPPHKSATIPKPSAANATNHDTQRSAEAAVTTTRITRRSTRLHPFTEVDTPVRVRAARPVSAPTSLRHNTRAQRNQPTTTWAACIEAALQTCRDIQATCMSTIMTDGDFNVAPKHKEQEYRLQLLTNLQSMTALDECKAHPELYSDAHMQRMSAVEAKMREFVTALVADY
jgi:hypothetical protein